MDGQVNIPTVSDENLVDKSSVAAASNKSEEIAEKPENELRTFRPTSVGILETDEDDDNVSGDGLGKESDGNIDEDELLKDTESDTILKNDSICCAEEEEAILESNSDSSNALQPINKEISIVKNNVSSNLENIRVEQQPEEINIKLKKDLMETSFREKKFEKQSSDNVIQSEETPRNLEKNSDDNIHLNKDVSDIIRSSDKICIETKTVLTVENELNPNNSVVLKSSRGSDGLSVNNDENLNKQYVKNLSYRGIENTINEGNNMSVDNERGISNNDMEENENVSTFLHIDQEDTRPDDCLETMELSVEDPFAQTAEDNINNIGNDQITLTNNDKTTAIDHAFPNSNKVIADNSMSLNSDKNIHKNNIEVNSTKNNISSTTAPQDISSMEIEPVESSNSSTSLSQFTSLTADKDTVNSNKEDCIDTCPKDKHMERVIDSASQSEPIEQGQKKNNFESNDQICEKSVTNERNYQSSSLENSKNNDLCIVPDKDLKQVQEPNIVTSATVAISTNSCRSKSIKLSSKTSKAKSKKNVSDESSDDSDFEVSAKSTSRPKRDAAKKAESQIKVSFCLQPLSYYKQKQYHMYKLYLHLKYNTYGACPESKGCIVTAQ